MSFRKSFSSEKGLRINLKPSASSLNKKPIGLFERFFTRNSAKACEKADDRFDAKTIQNSDQAQKTRFLWDLELELIYTGNVLRQRLDELNRDNLTLQLNECACLLRKRLVESQIFIESLSLDSDTIFAIRDSLDKLTVDNHSFAKWTESLSDTDKIDQTIGQNRFMYLEKSAKSFIDLIKTSLDDNSGEKKKRRSIDNGSLTIINSSNDHSCKSRFNEEDREFIEKLKKLEENNDRAPPKPQLVHANQQSIEEYLTKIENIVRAESEPIYEYSEINNIDQNLRKSCKVENNWNIFSCRRSLDSIMATSMITNDIPTVDGEVLSSTIDLTPTPDISPLNNLSVNRLTLNDIPNRDASTVVNCRRSMPERDKNMPLPPVPVTSKSSNKFKGPQIPTSFHSEDHHHRKKSMSSNERSKVTNRTINNFNHRSPLRSPGFVSFINKSQVTQSPTKSINSFNENSLKSPCSLSQKSDDFSVDGYNLGKSRHLLMAKQIPSVVSDPNHLLNISDMQDDIDIVSRSLNCASDDDKREESKRLSNCSADTTHSLPVNSLESNTGRLMTSTDEDGTIYNSEVKSDTEEYFEYFVIDGKKYRRKMKKRTVIEKIKIQKTVYAPLKPDGSGPDLAKFDEDDQEMLDAVPSEIKSKELCNVNEQSSENEQPIFRRPHEDRFRVCRSMFLPYRDTMKKLTLNCGASATDDRISKTPALLNNYMYRFGHSDFEVPPMDKRLSTQLLDDVNSTWMKTSEFNLPHEKSRSICYFKKIRQKNEDGNTVHSAFSITTSRTVKMKTPDNVTQSPPECSSNSLVPPTITIGGDDYAGDDDDEESDYCVSDLDKSSSSKHDSFPMSTDDEKEREDSPSSQESLSAEHEETLSTTSTMDDDSEYHDSLIDEPLDNVPKLTTRSPSPDSCCFSSGHSSFVSDSKDLYSFILKEVDPSPYLIFDAEAKPDECDVAGGPVDALIVHACDSKDFLFCGVFLDTYRTFIEPEDLINRLIIRYKFFRSKQSIDSNDDPVNRIDSGCIDNGNDAINMNRKSAIDDNPVKKCKHILSLLITIIGKLKKDLNDRINNQIQMFEKYLQEINEDIWIQTIKFTIKTQKQSLDKDCEMVLLLNKMSAIPQSLDDLKSPGQNPSSPSKSGLPLLSGKYSILDLSSREIAEQMTLLDWGKYRDVELIEVLNLKDIANCKLPGVIEYAKHFQNVQYWTQSTLLDPDKKAISDRDRHCWKFLRIMKHLRKLCNFSSLIAILLGIQLLPVKKLFSKRIRSKIMEMDDYMKPTKFVGYKEDLKQAVAPCIPFLGIFYQDIVMLNIANPPYLDLDDIAQASRQSIWNTDNYQNLASISEQCGPIINFWRSFKQYLFLKNCNKDQDKIRYSIKPNERILQFLNNFQDRFDESTIQRLAKQL